MLTDRGVPVENRQARTAFEFCAWMAANLAVSRGGATSDHMLECAQYLEMVVGPIRSGTKPLPDGYDWTPAGATELVATMQAEYD